MRRWPTAAGIAYPVFIACAGIANVYFQNSILTSRVPSDFRGTAAAPGAVAVIVLAAVASLIVARRPRNRIGWVLILATFTALFSFVFAPDYGAYGIYVIPGSLPAPLLPSWIAGMTFPLFFMSLIVVLPLIYPDGGLPSGRWAWVLVLAGVATLFTILQPLDPNYFANDHLANPYSITAFKGYNNGALAGVGAVLVMIAGLLSTASVVVRYRRSGSEERHQIKWFAAAIALLAVVFVLNLVTGQPGGPALPAAVAAVGVAIAVAVLKYRLYDIDVVISRAVVYGSLAAFITAVYVGIVVGIGSLVGVGGKPNLGLSILATAIVAVGFQPVRTRLQKVANRLVYGERASPYEVLAQFSARVAGSYPTDDVMPRMAQMLAEGTGAQRADVWLRTGTTWRDAAVWPTTATVVGSIATPDDTLPPVNGANRLVEVRHQGDLLGALGVTKRPGESLTPVEENLLTHLAGQAGLVLRNVGLTSALQARLEELRVSRQRLVTAQDEERRRLERNLHDGAQQHLVALKVKLGLAEMLITRDPDKAKVTLDQLKLEANEALETLRDLARGIYPPLLAEKGLGAALESQARKATVPVTVKAPGLGRYSQEVEAAVYFSVLEALQNVQKYAQASRAVVHVRAADGLLRFEVIDDGQGFDVANHRKGSGLINMADRLDALGGEVEVTSTPGHGTSLHGWLQVAPRTDGLP